MYAYIERDLAVLDELAHAGQLDVDDVWHVVQAQALCVSNKAGW